MRALSVYKIKYSDFFRDVDGMYNDQSVSWDKTHCYCPIGLCLSYVTEIAGLPDATADERLHISSEASKLAVLASWRKAKSIYLLDRDLALEFMETAGKDLDVDASLLEIPEWCIYIKTDVFRDNDGFMVMFDDDVARGNLELYVAPMDADGKITGRFYLPLPRDGSMKLSDIMASEKVEISQTDIGKDGHVVDRYLHISRHILKFVINVLLYLSAINSEVRPVGHHPKRLGRIKDRPKEVAVYSVGEKTGYRIRQLKKYASEHVEPRGGHHRSPVMHVRRAHWHTFAYGHGRTERRVKWLPPIIVNAEGREVETVTITPVRKEEHNGK